jgi:hypothetical protein
LFPADGAVLILLYPVLDAGGVELVVASQSVGFIFELELIQTDGALLLVEGLPHVLNALAIVEYGVIVVFP